MRIATWNLGHGGRDAEQVADAVCALDADLAVLTEYRRQPGRPDVAAACRRRGRHAYGSGPAAGENGVLVVSRRPLPPPRPVAGPWASRVLLVRLDGREAGLALLAPSPRRGSADTAGFWAFVQALVEAEPAVTVLAGDFKTTGSAEADAGSSSPLGDPDQLGQRIAAGWHDALGLAGEQPPMLDHVLLSSGSGYAVAEASVIHCLGPHVLSHRRDGRPLPATAPPLSDRPALLVELGRR